MGDARQEGRGGVGEEWIGGLVDWDMVMAYRAYP